jgi:drug/metabolite transporter (DMT)-like permease
MTQTPTRTLPQQPTRWSLLLAFGSLYTAWGTTYLAIRKGVETLPPALFGGTRVALAGLVLLTFLAVRGRSLRVSRRDFLWTAAVGVLMFVGGNGLLTFAELSVPSGVAAVLGATSPFCLVLLELLWPRGERLAARGWLGLCAGLGGVTLLMVPKLQGAGAVWHDTGPFLVLGSGFFWACGSFLLRHRTLELGHLASAGYQMVVGGSSMCLIGLAIGEGEQLSHVQLTPAAVYSFFHLLVFGSLVGFVAYNWLLGHVSAALAGTYAYVNPAIALLAGWLIGGETITWWIVGGMMVVLVGVALVRDGTVRSSPDRAPAQASDAVLREAAAPVVKVPAE